MRKRPEWATENAFAKRFFKWLSGKNCPVLLEKDTVFTKIPNKEFHIVYMGQNLKSRASNLYQGMEFAGIFNQKTFEFTDVSYTLRTLLNIPKEKKFRFQHGCKRNLEKSIHKYALRRLEKGKVDFTLSAAEKAVISWKYRDLIEKAAADVIFEETPVAAYLIPQREFAFDSENYVFDNQLYFCYLRNGKSVIRRYGKWWAKELKYREIMERFFEEEINRKVKFLLQKQSERIEKIRTLKKALVQVHHTVLVVASVRQGVFEYFHMDSEVLKNTTGKYPISQLLGQEKKYLKKKYGSNKIWDIEEIYQVGARDVWYYNALAEQKKTA